MPEKAYDRHAWILLLAVGIFGLIFASSYISIAVKSGVHPFTLFLSLFPLTLSLLGFAPFGLAISPKSYRRGEKWAWYVSWYLPVFYGAGILLTFTSGYFGYLGVWPIGTFLNLFVVFFVLSVLGLLLPYRKFFPRTQQTPDRHVGQ